MKEGEHGGSKGRARDEGGRRRTGVRGRTGGGGGVRKVEQREEEKRRTDGGSEEGGGGCEKANSLEREYRAGVGC